MTQIATGVFKKLVAKKQTGLGTKASADGAQLFRRVTSTLDLKKATYQSKEIRPSMQRADMRHGIRSVDGTISGELSVGTYEGFMASVLRAPFAAVSAYAAGSDVTAQAAAPQFSDASGGYLAAGLKVGMVGRWSGFAGSPGSGNNGRNFLITALTDTAMTGVFLDGGVAYADAAGDAVTFTPVGKYCAIPQSGHVRDYWTIEHNFSDIGQSEQFVDCVFGDMNVKMPSTGMATVDFPVMGLNMEASAGAYFTNPAPASSGANLAAVNGAAYIAGQKVAQITGLDFSIKGNMSKPGGVVGSNTDPDIFPGSLDVTGSMTVLFSDTTLRDQFLNETEVSLIVALVSGTGATADFQVHNFPRVKLGGASKDDGEKGLTMTVPFTALENVAGGANTATVASTYWVQDSAAV